jgi:hypothetical protein
MSQNPQDRQPYPLRLPNYRFLHQGRYHPYPTFNRQQGATVTSQEVDDVEVMVGAMCHALDLSPSPSPPASSKEDPNIPTNEAGPSAQPQLEQDPPVILRFSSLTLSVDRALQTQTQLAASKSVDTDLTNLATVVDELQGSGPGGATSRDHVSPPVARLPILIR